jgi:mycothiol synthase
MLENSVITIPGLRFRMFTGEVDLEPNVVLNNICSRADGADWVDTLSAAQHWLAEADDMSNPYRDMLFAEVHDQMVARGITGWFTDDNGNWIYWLDCVVHPEWRGKGIGGALLNWLEQHAKELAATHNSAGKSKFFQSRVDDHIAANVNLLQRAGYKPVRYGFLLKRSLGMAIPDIALPIHFEVRPAKPDHYRAIFDAELEVLQEDGSHHQQTDEDYRQWQMDTWFQPELFRVAWDTQKNEVAATVLSYINHEQNKTLNRKRGYTQSICVRRPYRQTKIAEALLAMSLHLHKSLGMDEVALGIDTKPPNGELQHYQSMGFVVERQGTTYRKVML